MLHSITVVTFLWTCVLASVASKEANMVYWLSEIGDKVPHRFMLATEIFTSIHRHYFANVCEVDSLARWLVSVSHD